MLANGSIEFLTDGYPLAYLRKAADGSETLLVLINADAKAHTFTLPQGSWKQIYLNGKAPEENDKEITAAGQSSIVYQLEQA